MNEVVMPTYKLKAFLALSKGRRTNTRAALPYAAATMNRLLLVDLNGGVMRIAHTNQMWFVEHNFFVERAEYDATYWCLDIDKLRQLDLSVRNKYVKLDLDELRATFVGEDYLKGTHYSNLVTPLRKGDGTTCSTFDVGLLQAVYRFFKDVRCNNVNVIYPDTEYSPIQWDYGAGEYQALLMPIRS